MIASFTVCCILVCNTPEITYEVHELWHGLYDGKSDRCTYISALPSSANQRERLIIICTPLGILSISSYEEQVFPLEYSPCSKTVPTPQPTLGSAVLKVEKAMVLNYAGDIYNGKRQYPYPVPLTLGSSAIGRVVALGPDAVSLKVGDLCLLDITISARDDIGGQAGSTFLSAIIDGFTPASKKLMKDVWRDGAFAEYVRWPLENCHVVDETKTKALGYRIEDLMYISKMLVSYGGLGPGCVDVRPGETVIVSPATGGFGSAAVHVALELGAGRVIAMGRNGEVLRQVKEAEGEKGKRIECVGLTGVWEEDLQALKGVTGGAGVDVFFDVSPPAASGSGHLKAGVMALKKSGRVCLMGGIQGDIGLPHERIMHWNLTVKGKWMFEREDVKAMIRLVETGVVSLYQEDGIKPFGTRCEGKYKLEKWQKAFDEAARVGSDGFVLIEP
ncbi:GroES-like protein [Exophiala viscosa]|uniref:GroES-like protein n=1 Tax=Exophiala viscosa TaxID=2486360 RepID=A0AAN6IBZ3_9EURO|nr:GroES-like protein [Exophiala viscosa]